MEVEGWKIDQDFQDYQDFTRIRGKDGRGKDGRGKDGRGEEGRVEGWRRGRGDVSDDEYLLFLQINVENCSKKLYHENIPFDTASVDTASIS